MYVDHPGVWKPQSPDATVWRYMSLAKYYALLANRRFFLSNLSSFQDEREGTIPPSTAEHVRTINESLRIEQPKIMPFETMMKHRDELRRSSFALCWNEAEHEAVGLWERYTKKCDGVAVRSTASRLTNIGASHQAPFYVGKVKYINYRHNDPIPDLMSSLFYPLLLKDHTYAEEKEIRVLHCDWERLAQISAISGSAIQSGIAIDIDPTSVITECRVPPNSPQWYLDLVKQMTAHLGYTSIPVTKSEMDL
jgi:hypothetical protein